MPLFTGTFNSFGRAKTNAQKKYTWFTSKENKPGSHPAGRKNPRSSKTRGNQTAKKIQPSSVIFVPKKNKKNRGGLLAKQIQEREDRLCDLTGFRINSRRLEGTS